MQTKLAVSALAMLAGLALALPSHAERGEQSGHGRASGNTPNGQSSQRTRPTTPGTQQNFSLSGHPTQRIKPSEMRGSVRPDGSYSVITGQLRDARGRIVGPHSHSVVKDGVVVYSRTANNPVPLHDDSRPPAMTRGRTASPPPASSASRPAPRGGGAKPDGRLGGYGGGMVPRGGGGGPPWLKK